MAEVRQAMRVTVEVEVPERGVVLEARRDEELGFARSPRTGNVVTGRAGEVWQVAGMLASDAINELTGLLGRPEPGGESRLVAHARRELAGMAATEPEFADAILGAVVAMAPTAEDSGGAFFAAQDVLRTLLNFGTLSPLSDDPDEWVDQSETSGVPLWQSRRNPEAFSEDGGRSYYVVDERDGDRVRVVSAMSDRTVLAELHRLVNVVGGEGTMMVGKRAIRVLLEAVRGEFPDGVFDPDDASQQAAVAARAGYGSGDTRLRMAELVMRAYRQVVLEPGGASV